MDFEPGKKYSAGFLCEYLRIHDLSDINELLASVKKLTVEHKQSKFIITLDNIAQATYTSMHSIARNSLDEGDWIAKENIDDSLMDGDYFRDDLNFEQNFAIRRMGFKHGLLDIKFEDIFDKNLSLNHDSKIEMVEANKNLLSLMDKEVYLLKVPVTNSYEAILAFPNGYFSSDLSPFENYLFAKKLEEHYGFYLFGIGASYLSFNKGIDFCESKIPSLVDLLIKIYSDKDDELFAEFLRESILKQDILTLRYSE